MTEKKTSTVAKVLIIVLVAVLVLASLLPALMPFFMQGEKSDEKKVVTLTIVKGEDVQERTYESSYVKLGDFLNQTDLVGFKTSDYGRYVSEVEKVKPGDGEEWGVQINGEDIEEGVDFTKFNNNDKITLILRKKG